MVTLAFDGETVMVGDKLRLASISRPKAKIRELKSKDNEKNSVAEKDQTSSSVSVANLARVQRGFLFRKFKLSNNSKALVKQKSNSQINPYNPNLMMPLTGNLPNLPELRRSDTLDRTRAINYLDLNIVEKYAQRELIYGAIRQKNKRLDIKVEIITYNMKKYIIFRVKRYRSIHQF